MADKNENSWKREVAEILRKYKVIDRETVGKISLDINGGGILGAYWERKKIE